MRLDVGAGRILDHGERGPRKRAPGSSRPIAATANRSSTATRNQGARPPMLCQSAMFAIALPSVQLLIFDLVGRVDDTRDMPRSGEHELDGPAEHLDAAEDRGSRRDVILARAATEKIGSLIFLRSSLIPPTVISPRASRFSL